VKPASSEAGFLIFVLMQNTTRLYTVFTCCLLLAFTACETATDQDDSAASQTPTAPTSSPVDARLDSINDAIVGDPSNIALFVQRAALQNEAGARDEAYKDLDRALQIDSTSADVYFKRGNMYFEDQAFDKAIEDYRSCVQYDGDNTGCLLKLGQMETYLQNYTKAIQHINDALRNDEQLPMAYYLKGRIYKETGDTVLAASSYQTAIEVDPDFYDAYIEVGLLYAAAESDLALEYYRTATELRPQSVEAWYNMGLYLQQTGTKTNGRFYEAFDAYDKIIDIDPANATAPYNKGFIYLEYLQEYDSAATYFTRATELYPGYFQAYYNKGLALESLGRKEEALQEYNRALSLQPDYTPAALAKGRVLGE
jgi:tetratricopeptide (TPR) repeat protein